MQLTLQRDDQNAIRTLGTLGQWQTLELPWENNVKDKSCIPAGTYLCELRFSPVHNMKLFWITGVKDREDVEIHWGNFARDTKGCVLLGMSRENNAIDNSHTAFNQFMESLQTVSTFILQIVDPVK
jgi:hypothetical protein